MVMLMNIFRCSLRRLALLSLLLSSCGVGAPAYLLPDAERWEPVEIRLEAEVRAANPFLVRFEAKLTAPDGSAVIVPGFHDGGIQWKLRVMPSSLGLWRMTTDSDEPGLKGRSYEFKCTESKRVAQHGRLRIDSEHPRHFKFEDGTRHFMLAYECDWLWALDTDDPKMPRTQAFLDRIGGHGFNTVIVNTFAYDTSWRAGRTGDDDFGPPPQSPWLGTALEPDHLHLNPAFWQHYDRMIQALHEGGMITHLLCKVYNKKVKWPGRESKGEALFFRTLIARYGAYPGMVWDFSKEAHNEKNLDYKLNRLRYLREADPFKHLVTVHDDDQNYESGVFDQLVDFRTDQQHSIWRKKILKQRSEREWPLMNSEFGYEHGAGGMEDKTYGVVQAPEEFVRRAWEISMAGGYTAYYHTHTAWDVLRPEIDPPGYQLFGALKRFFESTRFWELVPRAESVDGVWILENPGQEYVCWVPANQSVNLLIPAEAGPMVASWVEPLTGKTVPVANVELGEQTIVSPAELRSGAAVLHLTRAPR